MRGGASAADSSHLLPHSFGPGVELFPHCPVLPRPSSEQPVERLPGEERALGFEVIMTTFPEHLTMCHGF